MRLLTALALTMALAGCGGLAQGACSFQPPQGWDAAATRWDGACTGGRADGLGVLKLYGGGKVERFFFGRLKNGELEIGVIELPEGYRAGRFEQGRVVPTDERQTMVSAFAQAEKAAQAAAERFAKAGNKASSAFYQDKARQLRDQLD